VINFKKIFFISITASLTLLTLLALVLFFYTIFFFEKPIVQKQTTESEEVINVEKPVENVEEPIEKVKKPVEKIETTKKITKDNTKQVKSTTSKSKTAIKDALYASIGNKAITKLDIVNEMKIILILTNQSFSENTKDHIQAAATQSIIKRIIKTIEIEKYKSLSFNPTDLQNELEKWAQNINMDLDTFKNTFVVNKINFSDISSRVKTELLWNSLIFELYKNRLIVNEDEINDQLKTIQNKKEVKEYLISEIIIKPTAENKLETAVKEIKNKIKTEGFEKVAMNQSISETAFKGGDLGWVNENAIAKKFKSQIINTAIGSISQPIILPQGILFFKIRNKRKMKKNINFDNLKKQLVNAERTKILNMYSLSHYDSLNRSITIKYY
jgi:parvulin-like peptidyl-prolyl isomerase|tara:strand:- start:3852 stop:5006 length:1155 start_codon:yes stop_codon:yes gene_type:complete